MIDQITRNKFYEQQRQEKFLTSIKDLIAKQPPVPSSNGTPPIHISNVSIKNFSDLNKYFTNLQNEIRSLRKDKLPSSFVIDNFFELKDYFDSLEQRISALAMAISSIPKTEAPKITLPKTETKPDMELRKLVTKLIETVKESVPPETKVNMDGVESAIKKVEFGIQELVQKPTMTPTSVTKMDINPLRGQFQSTLVTVTTSPTALPGNAATRRRSLIAFNEDTTKTLRVGGAAVVFSGTKQGLPVLAQSYSPSFDCGPTMILYGVVTSGSIQVTVLEAENDYAQGAGPSAGTTVSGYNV